MPRLCCFACGAVSGELAVEGSDPRVFGAAMAKADLGWVAVLPGLWTGDKKAARALEGDGADIAALRADLEQAIKACIPEPCAFTLDISFSSQIYVTNQHEGSA